MIATYSEKNTFQSCCTTSSCFVFELNVGGGLNLKDIRIIKTSSRNDQNSNYRYLMAPSEAHI